MEEKNIIAFEIEKEGKLYRLEVPHGAPLGEAYEATASFLARIVELINDHAQKMMPKEPEDVEDAEAKSESKEEKK
jgi:hypothetical protein